MRVKKCEQHSFNKEEEARPTQTDDRNIYIYTQRERKRLVRDVFKRALLKVSVLKRTRVGARKLKMELFSF
jgi:16S rRNA U516 pseudouridylate synthase RsuA-like enzyme